MNSDDNQTGGGFQVSATDLPPCVISSYTEKRVMGFRTPDMFPQKVPPGHPARDRYQLRQEDLDLSFTPGLHNIEFVTWDESGSLGYSHHGVGVPPFVKTSIRRATKENSWNSFERQSLYRLQFDNLNEDARKVFCDPNQDISGILWRNDWYGNDNFEECHYLCVEIDHGKPSLAELLSALAGKVSGIVWTSKSHQIFKGEESPCDRYHLILLIDDIIRTLAKYKQVSAALMTVLFPDCDPAITNGSFKFRGGPPDCQLHSLNGDHRCISVTKLIDFAKHHSPAYKTAYHDIEERYVHGRTPTSYFSFAE